MLWDCTSTTDAVNLVDLLWVCYCNRRMTWHDMLTTTGGRTYPLSFTKFINYLHTILTYFQASTYIHTVVYIHKIHTHTYTLRYITLTYQSQSNHPPYDTIASIHYSCMYTLYNYLFKYTYIHAYIHTYIHTCMHTYIYI